MSVDYYALSERSEKLFLENLSIEPPLEIEEIAAEILNSVPDFKSHQIDNDSLAKLFQCSIEEAIKKWRHIELNWADDEEGGYVQVVVGLSRIAIHTAGGGDSCLTKLMDVFRVLEQQRFHIYDPQNSRWL